MRQTAVEKGLHCWVSHMYQPTRILDLQYLHEEKFLEAHGLYQFLPGIAANQRPLPLFCLQCNVKSVINNAADYISKLDKKCVLLPFLIS